MFFEVFSFSGLQVEPCVRKRSDVRQKCFDEGMKFILKKSQRRVVVTETIDKKPPETGLPRETLRLAGTVGVGRVLTTFYTSWDSHPTPMDSSPTAAASPLHLAPTRALWLPPHKNGIQLPTSAQAETAQRWGAFPGPQISLKKRVE